jgi:hypothetical protein
MRMPPGRRAVRQPVLGFPHTFTRMALRGASRTLCAAHQRMSWSLVVVQQREGAGRQQGSTQDTRYPYMAGVATR